MPMKLWEINTAICEALGIDASDVSRLTLELNAADWPTVTVIRHADDFDVESFARVTERFELRERGR